jgi:heme-degrading monooxygenase HmoA
MVEAAGAAAMAALAAGQCLRLVPSRVQPDRLADWLAAHSQHHTPAVRRQPGFIAKVILQAEDEPERVVMLLVWETSAQARAWVAHPEHDVVSARVSAFADRAGGPVTAAPRGGYRLLSVVTGEA